LAVKFVIGSAVFIQVEEYNILQIGNHKYLGYKRKKSFRLVY